MGCFAFKVDLGCNFWINGSERCSIRLYPFVYQSIHHSLLIQGQQVKPRCPGLPLHSYLLQLFQEDSEVFPSQLRDDVISSVSPGSAPGSAFGWACSKYLTGEAPGGKCPNHFTWVLWMQRNRQSPLSPPPPPVSKGKPRHLSEGAHFHCFYPQFCCFSCYPQLMATAEGRTKSQPVNQQLQLYLCHDSQALCSLYGRRCTDPPFLSHLGTSP